MLSDDDVRRLLLDVFPLTNASGLSLELRSQNDGVLFGDDQSVIVDVALGLRDPDGQTCDVKEQQFLLLDVTHRNGRGAAFVRASARALREVDFTSAELETVMPEDLFFPEAFESDAHDEAGFLRLLTSREQRQIWHDARRRADAMEELETYGITEYPVLLEWRARDSLVVVPKPGTEDLPTGESRLGGAPDLPDGIRWPTIAGHPLRFLAQIDLSTLLTRELPRSGFLYFFHDLFATIENDRVSAAERRGGGRVFFFDGARSMLRRSSDPPCEIYPPRGFDTVQWEQLPSLESPHYKSLVGASEYTDPRLGVFESFVRDYGNQRGISAYEEDRPRHKILGFAEELQGDPYSAAEAEERGARIEDESVDFFRRAARWRLLLQLDSDHENGPIFGDGGVLYFFLAEVLVDRRSVVGASPPRDRCSPRRSRNQRCRSTGGRFAPICDGWVPRGSVSPRPRLPNSLRPQHLTVALSRSAHVNSVPALSAFAVRPGPRST